MKKILHYTIILILNIFIDLFIRHCIIFYIACQLLKEGVAAIFGPSSRYTSRIVASIAARFNIPHIEYVWRESERKKNQKKTSSSMTINVFPASEQVSQVSHNLKESQLNI